MDKQTKNYRKDQLAKVQNTAPHKAHIKIFGSAYGETHCLSVTKAEFQKISNILTGSKRKV